MNRFALLHPDIVKLVIAGGVSGTLILPFKKYKNNSLMYPVGIGNIDEISDYKVTKKYQKLNEEMKGK